MIPPEYLTSQQVDELTNRAVVFGDFILASGIKSNVKFDFDRIHTDSELFKAVTLGLSECVSDNFADFDAILTVANGATRLGEPLSELLSVPHMESSYEIDERGKKVFAVNALANVGRPVIIDDVFTSGTNATKVAQAAIELGIEPTGAVVVLDRSGILCPQFLGNRAVNSLVKLGLGSSFSL